MPEELTSVEEAILRKAIEALQNGPIKLVDEEAAAARGLAGRNPPLVRVQERDDHLLLGPLTHEGVELMLAKQPEHMQEVARKALRL